jgi:hypothetical protein
VSLLPALTEVQLYPANITKIRPVALTEQERFHPGLVGKYVRIVGVNAALAAGAPGRHALIGREFRTKFFEENWLGDGANWLMMSLLPAPSGATGFIVDVLDRPTLKPAYCKVIFGNSLTAASRHVASILDFGMASDAIGDLLAPWCSVESVGVYGETAAQARAAFAARWATAKTLAAGRSMLVCFQFGENDFQSTTVASVQADIEWMRAQALADSSADVIGVGVTTCHPRLDAVGDYEEKRAAFNVWARSWRSMPGRYCCDWAAAYLQPIQPINDHVHFNPYALYGFAAPVAADTMEYLARAEGPPTAAQIAAAVRADIEREDGVLAEISEASGAIAIVRGPLSLFSDGDGETREAEIVYVGERPTLRLVVRAGNGVPLTAPVLGKITRIDTGAVVADNIPAVAIALDEGRVGLDVPAAATAPALAGVRLRLTLSWTDGAGRLQVAGEVGLEVRDR